MNFKFASSTEPLELILKWVQSQGIIQNKVAPIVVNFDKSCPCPATPMKPWLENCPRIANFCNRSLPKETSFMDSHWRVMCDKIGFFKKESSVFNISKLFLFFSASPWYWPYTDPKRRFKITLAEGAFALPIKSLLLLRGPTRIFLKYPMNPTCCLKL